MPVPVGIRREDKSRWERRTPLTPPWVRRLRQEHGLEVYVQSSPQRIIPDEEFAAAGAIVGPDLSPARLIVGIKEVPPHAIEPGKVYMLFAHVIKGQSHNMPMLQQFMRQGCTLIDYEKVTDDRGRRLIFFGWHAGVVAMIEAFWALGQRLAWEGIRNPFEQLTNTYRYPNLDAARRALRAVSEEITTRGLPSEIAPLTLAIVGYGNVGRGAQDTLADMPVQVVEPKDIPMLTSSSSARRDVIYVATFKEQHIVMPREAGAVFELQDYYAHPERYQPCFAAYLPHLTMIVHANYWDARYPRLITKADIAELYARQPQPRLRVIADASCDVEGGVECTILTTEPDEPVYVYNPTTGTADLGVAGRGPVILAVDILPSELPLEASEYFSDILGPFIPAMAQADYDAPWSALALPSEIRRAVIVHRGELTPSYRYLESYLAGL